MNLWESIDARIRSADARIRSADAESPPSGDLPRALKPDAGVRIGLLQRLASSRQFALGNRAGVLKAAQHRSGRSFRLDVRQRVVVKALVSRHSGAGAERRGALAHHVRYLGRAGAGQGGERAAFFDRAEDRVSASERTIEWGDDRHHFRFIVSPEHGDRIEDLRGYVRDVMGRVAEDLGEAQLDWLAVCHFDTDQPHAHILVRGRRADGRDLVIPRDYIGYGFRARAQEVAQERLGDISRADAERRIWRETEADRFTGFDRRLLAAVDDHRIVPDGLGRSGPWPALIRGRLRHLERLGLAEPTPRGYRLAEDLEFRLRRLQVSRDLIRTLNERRLAGARDVRQLGEDRVVGNTVKVGFHDEIGATPFIVVRDHQGVEHYARLSLGRELPQVGSEVALVRSERGVLALLGGRSGPEFSL